MDTGYIFYEHDTEEDEDQEQPEDDQLYPPGYNPDYVPDPQALTDYPNPYFINRSTRKSKVCSS